MFIYICFRNSLFRNFNEFFRAGAADGALEILGQFLAFKSEDAVVASVLFHNHRSLYFGMAFTAQAGEAQTAGFCPSAGVPVGIGTDAEKELHEITTAEALEHIANHEFGQNKMLPKIEASVHFVSQKPGRQAVITSIEHAKEAFLGKTGTVIS